MFIGRRVGNVQKEKKVLSGTQGTEEECGEIILKSMLVLWKRIMVFSGPAIVSVCGCVWVCVCWITIKRP